MKIYRDIPGWEYWYDRTRNGGRSWWGMRVDPEGNQLGEAIYYHLKSSLLAEISERDNQMTLETFLNWYVEKEAAVSDAEVKAELDRLTEKERDKLRFLIHRLENV